MVTPVVIWWNIKMNLRFICFIGTEIAWLDWIFYSKRQRPINLNTLGPRQNGRHFADDIFKCIFWNENVWISIKISLKFVPNGPINNIPLSEAMMVNLKFSWNIPVSAAERSKIRHLPKQKSTIHTFIISFYIHLCVIIAALINNVGLHGR